MRVYTDLTRVWDYNNLTEVLGDHKELAKQQYIVYPEPHGGLTGWVTACYDPKGFYGPGVIEVNGYFPEMDLAVKFAKCLEAELKPALEPESEEPTPALFPGYYRHGKDKDGKYRIYFDPDLKDDIRAKAESAEELKPRSPMATC